MTCPVCDSTDVKVINVSTRSLELPQLFGKGVARCNECSVLYDYHHAKPDEDSDAEMVNCPDCGTRTSAEQGTCSYCGATLGSPGLG